jgi:hypothetical protein
MATRSETNGRSFVFRDDCAKDRFSLVVVYGDLTFSPMGVTKVFINYKFYVLSDECQNVQPRRSNFIKPV